MAKKADTGAKRSRVSPKKKLKKEKKVAWDIDDFDAAHAADPSYQSEKEKAILEAAADLFSQQGPKASSLEIAKRAGTTERTLFKYFPTKEDLIRRVLIPIALRVLVPFQLERTLKLIREDWENPTDFIRAIYKMRLTESLRVGERMKFVVAEAIIDASLMQAIVKLGNEKVFPEVFKVVCRFQKEGKIREDVSSELITRMILSALFSQIMYYVIMSPDKKKLAEEEIDAVVSLIVGGCLPNRALKKHGKS